jgi:two-component system, OmpR family, response regulator VicR
MDPKKILIVDDEKPLAHALELKLTHEGYTVKTAFDGEEALAELGSKQYALALMDLMMPKLDGFGVLAKVKEQGIPTKIIVTSNLSQEEDIAKAKGLGAVDFFIKSNTPLNVIVEQLKKYLA